MGRGIIVIPVSSGVVYGLTVFNKVLYEIVIQKCIKYKKLYKKDQQTMISFNKLYRKCLQDNVIDENEYESLCNNFTIYLNETKKESFS